MQPKIKRSAKVNMEIIIAIVMCLLSLFAVETKDLIGASLFLGGASLMCALLFIYLQAPDVALAEASIGAALTTAVFIFAIKKTNTRKEG